MDGTIQGKAVGILSGTDLQESTGMRKSIVPTIDAMRRIVASAPRGSRRGSRIPHDRADGGTTDSAPGTARR